MQNAFLIKDFYSKYPKDSNTKTPLKMGQDLNRHLAKEDRRGHWAKTKGSVESSLVAVGRRGADGGTKPLVLRCGSLVSFKLSFSLGLFGSSFLHLLTILLPVHLLCSFDVSIYLGPALTPSLARGFASLWAVSTLQAPT